MSVSPKSIEVVNATVPVLREHGDDIILKFYDTLFTRYPQVKKYFNMDKHAGGTTQAAGVPAQVFQLSKAVMAYASNIDRIDVLLPVVEGICHRHVSRGVQAVQYDAVGECLIVAMGQVLGDAATSEIVEAWTEAYGVLAQIFIATEESIYEKLSKTAGFSGIVDMRVVSIAEDDRGGKLIGFVPLEYDVPPVGKKQFVAVSVELVDGTKAMTTMNLVSDGNSSELTIHVPKGEEKATKVLLDVRQGTVLGVSMPCGKVKA